MNRTWPTAGQRAFDTIEIRHQIFDLLPDKMLQLVCMRVCKGWMADIVRLIYSVTNAFELAEPLKVEDVSQHLP